MWPQTSGVRARRSGACDETNVRYVPLIGHSGKPSRGRKATQWARGLAGPEAWGYGINGGLRRMSDLETPEADMMRGHSSVDAARATLRLEESRPGLDPDNP